jgi:hypothetical protein
LLNSDALNGAVSRALKETSNSYLLAWKPGSEEQKGKNFRRLEVSVVGHPEYVVKLPKGYLQSQADSEVARADHASAATAKNEPAAPKSADADIRSALNAFTGRHGLPTTVSATYLDTPNNGTIITASVQAATAALDYGADSKEAAAIDLAGVVLNDQGKTAATFKTRLSVSHLDAAQQGDAGVVYNYKTPLAPGLYQVRAAARDQKSGKVGSASQWIEIPDLSKHQLTLSSFLLGAQVVDVKPKPDAAKGPEEAAQQVQFSVDRRFKRSSQLSFWLFIYNASRGANAALAPDLTTQIEIFGNGQTVVKTPVRKIDTTGMTDLQRISYGGQFPLAALAPGRYELKVTITDQVSHTSTAQLIGFQVE